jgi:CheY-like chemotaxis protein
VHEIFFVHDMQENPAARRHYLELAGFHVTPLRGSARCLEALEQRLPCLILLDVLIPGANGFELCRAIRAKHPPEKLPIVLGSHLFRSKTYVEEAAAAGAQRYLLYPVASDELLEVVTQVYLRSTPSQDVA